MKEADKRPRLKGTVLEINRTGEKEKDSEGVEWDKCIFTLSLGSYSKRTPELQLEKKFVGKKIKIMRYCSYDWHYKIGVSKTLEPGETKQVLTGKFDLTEV